MKTRDSVIMNMRLFKLHFFDHIISVNTERFNYPCCSISTEFSSSYAIRVKISIYSYLAYDEQGCSSNNLSWPIFADRRKRTRTRTRTVQRFL